MVNWLDCFPTLRDGYQFITRDLYTHYKDYRCGMDDHTQPIYHVLIMVHMRRYHQLANSFLPYSAFI